MGTVHQDTPTVFLLLLSPVPMDRPWTEGVFGPLLPCPQLGGQHHCPPEQSITAGPHRGHCATRDKDVTPWGSPPLSPVTGQEGWPDPHHHVPAFGGPTITPRTAHHPWPLLRSLRDCKGQGCEGTL